MTLTNADLDTLTVDDGPMGPRAERPRRRSFTAEYKLAVMAVWVPWWTGAGGGRIGRGWSQAG